MKKTGSNRLWLGALVMAVLFVLTIVLVKFVDVQPIGPEGSSIGLATLNGAVRDALEFSQLWYTLTEIVGYLALLVAAFFGFIGAVQLWQSKRITKVDQDILLLGGFYVLVAAFYVLFELWVVNYRPVILETELEASFPSSHTVLAVCIFGMAIEQFYRRVDHDTLRLSLMGLCAVCIAVMVIGRMLSGVHWCSDILGGVFLSGAIVLSYVALSQKLRCRRRK